MSRTSESRDPVSKENSSKVSPDTGAAGERARTDEALRSSEEKYRHLFNSIDEGFCILEALLDETGEKPVDYRFLEANPAFERLLGLQDIIGKSAKEHFSDGDASWCLAFARVVETGESVRFESQLVARNSWFELYVARLGESGSRRIAVVVNDITERKLAEGRPNYLLVERARAEERLRLLIESAEDYAIFTTTLDNRVNYWNVGAQRIFGYTDEEILGESSAILFTPEDRERGVPEDEIRTAAAEGRASDERWHISKSGERFYCSGVMTALRSGEVLRGFAKIARDLTAQKRAEEELRRAYDRLEERVHERTAELVELNQTLLTEVNERTVAEVRARRFMRQLVTAQEDERRNIARDLHDHLGQQLTGLRLKLQNHKDSCGDNERLRAEVEDIQVIAERVDEDLDFLEWELRPASLDEFGLAFALANFVQEWSRHFNIPAEFHTTGFDTERLPAEVEINLYRIAQEAMNNISKHAKARAVDVLFERRSSHVTLIIEDDGRGFDPEVLDSKADVKKSGLLNMRERASFIGGTVDIESHPGHGTTVFVRTPVSSPPPVRALKRGGSHEDD